MRLQEKSAGKAAICWLRNVAGQDITVLTESRYQLHKRPVGGGRTQGFAYVSGVPMMVREQGVPRDNKPKSIERAGTNAAVHTEFPVA